MEHDQQAKRVKVSDRRRAAHGGDSAEPTAVSSAQEAAGAAPSRGRDASPHGDASADAEAQPSGSPEPGVFDGAGTAAESAGAAPEAPDAEAARDKGYLDDLLRLQADFDNYRKRMMREQTSMAQRASERVVERLLPVLDNLERAIEHGDGGAGTELVYKELKAILEQEGLEEIGAEGEPFDPRLHEAFEVVEDAGVDQPTCTKVLRRGYRMKGRVLRPSMVAVARPPEHRDDTTHDAQADDDAAEA